MNALAFQKDLEAFSAPLRGVPAEVVDVRGDAESRVRAAESATLAWRQKLVASVAMARRLFRDAEQDSTGEMMQQLSEGAVPEVLAAATASLSRMKAERIARTEIQARLERALAPDAKKALVRSLAKRITDLHEEQIAALEDVIERLREMRIEHDPDLRPTGEVLRHERDVETYLARLASE